MADEIGRNDEKSCTTTAKYFAKQLTSMKGEHQENHVFRYQNAERHSREEQHQ